ARSTACSWSLSSVFRVGWSTLEAVSPPLTRPWLKRLTDRHYRTHVDSPPACDRPAPGERFGGEHRVRVDRDGIRHGKQQRQGVVRIAVEPRVRAIQELPGPARKA